MGIASALHNLYKNITSHSVDSMVWFPDSRKKELLKLIRKVVSDDYVIEKLAVPLTQSKNPTWGQLRKGLAEAREKKQVTGFLNSVKQAVQHDAELLHLLTELVRKNLIFVPGKNEAESRRIAAIVEELAGEQKGLLNDVVEMMKNCTLGCLERPGLTM